MTASSRSGVEPLATTLRRTVGIAVVVAVIVAWRIGTVAAWAPAAVLTLWFSFGGHWVEVWFLDWLRPRLPASRAPQAMVRISVWFAGGVALGFGMLLTTRIPGVRWPSVSLAWWVFGAAFVGVELIAHLVLLLRRRPSFYGGEG